MSRHDPYLLWQVAQLTAESRADRTGGLWAVFTAEPGQRVEVNFVYHEADQRHLAGGTDRVIREIFTAGIAALRADRADLEVPRLRALAGIYQLPRKRHTWQVVLIERAAVLSGWHAPNGIDNAVAEAPEGVNALGFLSLALPELFSDLIHGAAPAAT